MESYFMEFLKKLDFSYLISVPENFDKEKESLPLIIFLHGAGERGDDLEKVKTHGIPKLFAKSMGYRCITLSPQCKEEMIWNTQVYELKMLIDSVAEEYNVDKKAITITGISMGGYGTWEMASSFPDYFAAAAPICGGGISWRANLLKNMPIKAYHGDKDTTVSLRNSLEMVDAVNAAGGNAILIICHNVGHNVWDYAYEEDNLTEWLLKQRKTI